MRNYLNRIEIDIVKGGYILTYPKVGQIDENKEYFENETEVFQSAKKLNMKIKALIEEFGLVAN